MSLFAVLFSNSLVLNRVCKSSTVFTGIPFIGRLVLEKCFSALASKLNTFFDHQRFDMVCFFL